MAKGTSQKKEQKAERRIISNGTRHVPSLVQWGMKEGEITGTRARWLTPEVTSAILDTAVKKNHVVLQFAPQDSLQSVRLTLGAFARRKGYKAHAAVEGNTLRISLEKLAED